VTSLVEFKESGGWSGVETLGLEIVEVAVDQDTGRRHPDVLVTLRHPMIADGDRVLRGSLGAHPLDERELFVWGLESCAYPPDLPPVRGLPRAREDGPGMQQLHPRSCECRDERAIAGYLVPALERLLRSATWTKAGSRPTSVDYRPANGHRPAAYRVIFERADGDRALQIALQEPDGRRMAAGDAFDDFQLNLPLLLSDGFIAGLPRQPA
jgi:hypothetical protein